MPGEAHVLVVDDEAEIREMLREFLSGQGLAVSVADGGAAMREVMAERPVDLVILDLRMPGEDGLSLARSLRAEGGIGIVMLTAAGEPIDRVVGLEVGADDYLAKPFDPRELLARVRSVLRRVRPDGGRRRLRPRAARFGSGAACSTWTSASSTRSTAARCR